MAEKQNINQEIDHSEAAFYANGFSISSGSEVLFDFRQTLTRDDVTSNGPLKSVVAKHQPVVMSPQVAKMLLMILKEQVDGMEKAFGKAIELPKEWRVKPESAEDKKSSISSPYIR